MLRTQHTVFTLTVGYFFVELAGGVHFNSLALVTDAAFMAVNVMGQLIAILAARLSARQPDARHPFGYERAKVLSGLVNGLLVGFVVFYVFVEAYDKIKHPEPIEAGKVLVIALLGLAVNGFGLVKLGDEVSDINIKRAYVHVLTDALGSVGVVVSCTVIYFTGFYIVDAMTGMMISLLVAYPTFFWSGMPCTS
jgi:cobalt-zinc-cadmium efflux system protein